MDNINNYPLVQSFKPLELFLLFFGHSYNTYHSKWLIVYNYVIQVLYFCFAFYLYLHTQSSPAFRIFTSNTLLFIAHRIQIFVLILCYVIIFINNFFHKKHIVCLFEKLNLIDSNFRRLNIYFRYSQNRRKLIVCIVLLFVSTVVLLVSTNLIFGSAEPFNWNSYAIFINFFVSPFLIYMKLILYANLCWEIKTRFDKINTFLRQEFDKSSSGDDGDGAMIESNFKDILIISKLYEELSDCIALINSGWSITSLAFIGAPFVSTIANFFLMFYFMVHTSDIDDVWKTSQLYSLISWMIFNPLPIIIISVACQQTFSASHQTSVLFHKCITIWLVPNDDIELISLQLHHQQSRFTAYGFFNIDDRLMFTAVSAITTYLVILLQFDAGRTSFISVSTEMLTIFYFVVHTSTSDQIWWTFEIYNIFCWIVYLAMTLVTIVTACNETVFASNQTSVLFHKYIPGSCNVELYDDIDVLSLKMHFHRKVFTANDFFNIDARLICSMFAAITTYLVILLQFDVGSSAGDNFIMSNFKT